MGLSSDKRHTESSRHQIQDEQSKQSNCASSFQDQSQDESHPNSVVQTQYQQPWSETPDAISWPPTTSDRSTSTPWIYDSIPSPLPPPSPVEPPPPPNRSIYTLQTRAGYGITVTPYDPAWPSQFFALHEHLHSLFTNSTPPAPYTAIEHIGSTSIPGLAAKPNIDILVTFPDRGALDAGIEALEWEVPDSPPFMRYTRVPNGGGIQGRESFKLYAPSWSEYHYSTPERSVYLIDESESNPVGRVQIRGYRSLRKVLCDPANEDLFREYADVKVELAGRVYDDSITYSRLKDPVVRKILMRAGWTEEDVDEKERLSERTWTGEEPAY